MSEMELPELTDEELAIVAPPDFEDEPDEDVQEPAPEPVEAEAAEGPEEKPEEQPEDSELETLKRANAGLLNDLRRTRAESKADREWKRVVEERMDILAKRSEKEEEDPDPEPSREEDPIAWLEWSNRRNVQEAVEPLKQNLSEQEERQKFEEFDRQVREETKVREEVYLRDAPVDDEEFNSRLDDLRFAYAKELQEKHGLAPEKAILETSKQERLFAIEALRNGLNPAEEAMKYWEELKPSRAPWRVKEDAVADPSESQAPLNEVDEPKKPLGKVDAAKAGAGTSGLGAMSGEGVAGEITFEMLAEMPEGDPIAEKIYSDEKKWNEINIYGKTTV